MHKNNLQVCPQEPVYCAPPGRSRLGHRQPIKSPLSTGSSCGILGMGNFILFLILICLTVLDLGCSGSSREVYFHEAYRVLSPGLPACCCPEQIISALCLHLTHTLKTDVNNGCRPGGTSLFPSKQTGVEGATVYRENGEAAVGRTSYPRAL